MVQEVTALTGTDWFFMSKAVLWAVALGTYVNVWLHQGGFSMDNHSRAVYASVAFILAFLVYGNIEAAAVSQELYFRHWLGMAVAVHFVAVCTWTLTRVRQ